MLSYAFIFRTFRRGKHCLPGTISSELMQISCIMHVSYHDGKDFWVHHHLSRQEPVKHILSLRYPVLDDHTKEIGATTSFYSSQFGCDRSSCTLTRGTTELHLGLNDPKTRLQRHIFELLCLGFSHFHPGSSRPCAVALIDNKRLVSETRICNIYLCSFYLITRQRI